MFDNLKSALQRHGAALATTAALTGAALPSAEALGGEMDSVSNYSQYQALSNDPMYQFSGSYTLKTISGQVITSEASCVAVAPTVVIGPAHGTPSATGTSVITSVSFGANYNNPAMTIPVQSWQRYPGYVSGDDNTIDLAVFILTQPIPGFTKLVTFADPSMGQMLTQVGFGEYGDASTGAMPSKGDRLAGNSVVYNSLVSPYAPSLYDSLDFQTQPNNVTIPTMGLPGDSGSAWYDSSGNLDLLSTASTNGVFGFGETDALRLDTQAVQDYLQPIIVQSWELSGVPEPSTFAVWSLAAVSLLLRRQRRAVTK